MVIKYHLQRTRSPVVKTPLSQHFVGVFSWSVSTVEIPGSIPGGSISQKGLKQKDVNVLRACFYKIFTAHKTAEKNFAKVAQLVRAPDS